MPTPRLVATQRTPPWDVSCSTRRYFVERRPRLATCGGVAWFHGLHLATLNLVGEAVHSYRFDPHDHSFTPVQARRLEGLVQPENLAVCEERQLLGVTSITGARITLYRLDPDTHQIDTCPSDVIPCDPALGPHGIGFSPGGEALAVTAAAERAGLLFFGLERSGASGVNIVPTQVVENRLAPLKPKGVAFSPDGRFVAVVYGRNAELRPHRRGRGVIAVHPFDAKTGRIADPVWTSGKSVGVRCAEDIAFLPDGSGGVVTDQALDAAIVLRFDSEAGSFAERAVRLANPLARLSFPHGTAVSGDGRFLAVANYGSDEATVYAVR
jgi:DNA-binding beta-propeller fold protein YncE